MVAELKSTGQKVVGLKQLLRELDKENVLKVYLAVDADEEIKQKVLVAARSKSLEPVWVDTMDELGDICQIDVKTACAGILKEKKEKTPSRGL
ncbi:MAG: ribosomal L7Ae/L30e/S12e/Gadd45 family protein [Christensenellaceae bacterium]|jgi:large subunit ribosomal protein L7A